MSNDKLARLIDAARIEMGPSVFRDFQNDLAGRKPALRRRRRLTCALCNGTGVSSMSTRPDGECAGCGGVGKF